MNHENDKEIENLFSRIKIEQDGKLDVLVNNAFKGGEVCITRDYLINQGFIPKYF